MSGCFPGFTREEIVARENHEPKASDFNGFESHYFLPSEPWKKATNTWENVWTLLILKIMRTECFFQFFAVCRTKGWSPLPPRNLINPPMIKSDQIWQLTKIFPTVWKNSPKFFRKNNFNSNVWLLRRELNEKPTIAGFFHHRWKNFGELGKAYFNPKKTLTFLGKFCILSR